MENRELNQGQNQGHSIWGIVGAFAAGAAAGSVTALLLAPSSGADTRKKLSGIPHAIKEAYTEATHAGVEAFTQSYAEQEAGKTTSHRR